MRRHASTDVRSVHRAVDAVLGLPEGAVAREAHEAVADALGLTEADKGELVPSGTQPIYKNRAGWAHDRLKRAGLSSAPRRGFWKLAPAGIEMLAKNVGTFPDELVDRLATGFFGVRLRPQGGSPEKPSTDELQPDSMGLLSKQSPDDRLGQALSELRQAAADELLEQLLAVSPAFFERAVLELLHRMGYGATRDDLQRVGGPGDGGIDGVISLDRLGLEKVYVQAKRWQGNVGRQELQAFVGALAGQKARKGVFITTSTYTEQAKGFARSVAGIVLIDGERLAGLMIDHELGVSSRVFKVPKIDSDYFEEEAG
jgi:restriction system protein